MGYREDGMSFEHSGARETHHFYYPAAHFALVAMDGAFCTRAFVRAEGTFVQTLFGVIEQLGTIRTEPAFGALVMRAAENLYHRGDGLFFSGQ
jgi:hypothetical protein